MAGGGAWFLLQSGPWCGEEVLFLLVQPAQVPIVRLVISSPGQTEAVSALFLLQHWLRMLGSTFENTT